ncbi:MAG TPA: magnesium-translocating P-type ATPase [Gemmata sp.]|nr:magnesium-translocating P-type ATPase [Gemmata sp.]
MTLPFNDAPRESGLTSEAARERLRRFGPNQPAAEKSTHLIWELLQLFENPLALVLIAAAGVSVWLGDHTGAAIIVAIVSVGAAINFVQTYRSTRAIRRLREGVAVTATVLRDGEWKEVPRREVVPDDIFRLMAGDLVPADARLLTARDLHLQQGVLTGESFPVEKEAGPTRDGPIDPSDRYSVFFGTSVVSGTATARAVATGPATAFGAIACRLASHPPETEFDRGTRRFGLFITQTVLVLVFFVFLVNAALERDPLESLLFAVALAVGLTPEFLPMITAVTLSAGAVRMARRKVVVKHLAAMQNLGSMDVLCSDKTGTLTSGAMQLVKATDPLGQLAERPFKLGYLNSTFETGIKSPLDAAILSRENFDVSSCRKVDEIPFDFERRRLSVVVDSLDGRLLITKGAFESVVECCSHYETGGNTLPLDSASRERIAEESGALGAQGHSLIAVAVKLASGQEVFRADDERGMSLVGFLAFFDPPREDAAQVIRALKHDGVVVKVLTGDSELVARHVCAQVGLDAYRVVMGEEVAGMTDSALGAVAEEAMIFARLNPAQKTRLILVLKARGHVVGFLGDGVNDAPSLRTADVGITVSTAADVAKDVAEVVLLEPGLGVLHAGIIEGRQAFGNVMKYLLMGTSSNFGNMLSMAAATAFLPLLPMLPVQILLNSLLYDLAQLAIPTDRVDRSYLHKPRRWNIAIIRRFMLVIGPVSSLFDFVTFAVLLFVFHASESLFHTGWFIESLATQTLVIFVIRTGKNQFHSRPSRALVLSVLISLAVGAFLPFSGFAGPLGFVGLPVTYILFVALATILYLSLVEVVKRRVLGPAIA